MWPDAFVFADETTNEKDLKRLFRALDAHPCVRDTALMGMGGLATLGALGVQAPFVHAPAAQGVWLRTSEQRIDRHWRLTIGLR